MAPKSKTARAYVNTRASNTVPGSANRPIGGLKSAIQANGAPRSPNETAASAWHSRGYLPHFESPVATRHITFRLADSLPKSILQRLEAQLKFLPTEKRDAERRKQIEDSIDVGHGSCALRKPSIAREVQGSLLNFDAKHYRLLAWVVMPNHVHALVQPINGWTVQKIVATWKKFTAIKINAYRRANGQPPSIPVWQREHWDRFIRDQNHFDKTLEYIRLNPVKAGLAAAPENWPWSSAYSGSFRERQ